MMLYRLHRREWEAGLKAQRNASMTASGAGGSNKHSTVTGGDDQTSKTEGINLTSDEQKTSKTSRGLHLDRKGTKKGIDGSTGSTSMFAACSVDASGRALTSIASISSRKSSKKDVKK